MNFRGTLLLPLDIQHDRDGSRIDPAGVAFIPDHEYPVSVEFKNDIDSIVGKATVSRDETGALVLSGELWGSAAEMMEAAKEKPEHNALKPAIGVIVHESTGDTPAERVYTKTTLFSIAVCREHADPDQPVIEAAP